MSEREAPPPAPEKPGGDGPGDLLGKLREWLLGRDDAPAPRNPNDIPPPLRLELPAVPPAKVPPPPVHERRTSLYDRKRLRGATREALDTMHAESLAGGSRSPGTPRVAVDQLLQARLAGKKQ